MQQMHHRCCQKKRKDGPRAFSVCSNLLQHSATNYFADFASHLELVLNNDTNLAAQDFPDFSVYFAALPIQRKDLSPNQRIEFDRKGVALWNRCCTLSKSDDDSQTLGNLAKGVIDIRLCPDSPDPCGSSSAVLSSSGKRSKRQAKRYILHYHVIEASLTLRRSSSNLQERSESQQKLPW